MSKTARRRIMVKLGLPVLCYIIHLSATSSDFRVPVDESGHYQVLVGGQPWLRAAPTFFTANKRHFTIADRSLVLDHTEPDEGYDVIGVWNSSSFYYQLSGTTSKVKVTVRCYRDQPLVLFGQEFLTGLDGSSVGDRFAVSSGFPNFYMEGTGQSSGRSEDLGYLAYGGIMTGDTAKSIGLWTNVSRPTSGLDSGPLVLFDKSNRAIIVSPFTNFMAASVQYSSSGGSMTATWGLMGTIDRVIRDTSYWTAVMYSRNGINELMNQWGAVMRTYYDKNTANTESDFANNYLGYWTDNGAYYYYLTEGQNNYEDTILDVKKYADSEDIPYRYVQYDSWFYPKGPKNGVTEWDSMKSIFPSGLQSVWEKTGWPVVAHNRWWSNVTVYAKQNGGKYDFVIENKTSKALPLDQTFWNDLMVNSKKWGLITYEQDWLNVQFDNMDATVESLTLARQWLHQMSRGASRSGITIQYCMAPSRYILTSLELPAVTQARVSTDYQPGQSNWKIGISSMFAHAMGLAPFKDNFWTSKTQTGNIYNASEPHTERHALVATLSTGPVGPSDKIGHSNVTLIMRSCNSDGLILKPSRPATALDKQLLMDAFTNFRGEVWSTYSSISGFQFGIILGADFKMSDKLSITPTEAGLKTSDFKLKLFGINNPWHIKTFSETSPLMLYGCTNYCLAYSTPVLNTEKGEVLIFGELTKWVTMSPKRITAIAVDDDEVTLSLTGGVREKVTMSYSVAGTIKKITCSLSGSGTAILKLVQGECLNL